MTQAPLLSYFMDCISSEPLMQRPPLSKVTPLPTTATRRTGSPPGRYTMWTSRGGLADPRPTAIRPFIPKPAISHSS